MEHQWAGEDYDPSDEDDLPDEDDFDEDEDQEADDDDDDGMGSQSRKRRARGSPTRARKRRRPDVRYTLQSRVFGMAKKRRVERSRPTHARRDGYAPRSIGQVRACGIFVWAKYGRDSLHISDDARTRG